MLSRTVVWTCLYVRPQGLVLHSVCYPPGFDDPAQLLYPNLISAEQRQRLADNGTE